MMNDGPAQASPHDLRRHAVSKAIRDALYRQRQNDSNVDTAIGLKMYTEDGYVEVDVDSLARAAMEEAPTMADVAEAEKDEQLRLACFDRVMAFYDNRTESTSFAALGPTPDMIAHKMVAAAREIFAFIKGDIPVDDAGYVKASHEAMAAEREFIAAGPSDPLAPLGDSNREV